MTEAEIVSKMAEVDLTVYITESGDKLSTTDRVAKGMYAPAFS